MSEMLKEMCEWSVIGLYTHPTCSQFGPRLSEKIAVQMYMYAYIYLLVKFLFCP